MDTYSKYLTTKCILKIQNFIQIDNDISIETTIEQIGDLIKKI